MIEKEEILEFLHKNRSHYLRNIQTICNYILESLVGINDLKVSEKRMIVRNVGIVLNDSVFDEGVITNLMGEIQNETINLEERTD